MSSSGIQLAELRELASSEALSQREFDALCDAIPALVDAVEALQALAGDASVSAFIGWSPSLETDAAIEAKFEHARDALARFDFGGVS